MSESLPPFEGENLASYEALKTAIELADGFTLIFAVTNTEAGAQEVMRRLWRDGVRYQKAWLRDPERPLVDQVLESVRSARLPVMVLGLEGLTTTGEALGRSLRNLNWTRPQWTSRLPQAIVFWVTADMEPLLAREAPDLWRFRSLRVEFHFGLLPRAARAEEIRRRLRKLVLAPRVHLTMLMELYSLTQSQDSLEQASKLIARTPHLHPPNELQNLKSLVLAGTEFDNGSLERLGPLPKLESMILYRTNHSDECVANLLSKSNPVALNYGDFRGTPIGPKTLGALAHLPNVAGIDIGSTLISKADLHLLSKFKKLSYLELKSSIVSDEELEIICNIETLSSLLIGRSAISDKGATCLPKLKRLWILEVDGTAISSKSIPSISRINSLRSLDMSRTRVSDAHIEMLAHLPRVQMIYLRETKVTKAGASKLRELFAAQRRRVEVIV